MTRSGDTCVVELVGLDVKAFIHALDAERRLD